MPAIRTAASGTGSTPLVSASRDTPALTTNSAMPSRTSVHPRPRCAPGASGRTGAWTPGSVTGAVCPGRAAQPASVPPNTCHASADFAVRLSRMYVRSPTT